MFEDAGRGLVSYNPVMILGAVRQPLGFVEQVQQLNTDTPTVETSSLMSNRPPNERKYRLGVVSYLNSRPLVQGLERDPNVELMFDVPARLPGHLESGAVDAALVPVVDMAAPGRTWKIISDACIGCDGETLTVRVFSRRPPSTVRRLHVDGDSHTSVILARIIWRACHGIDLDIRPYDQGTNGQEPEAVLLIGDKVINHTLIDYEIETDLGSEWKSLTSLPFVFAVWAARRELDTDVLSVTLNRARDSGVSAAEMIAEDLAPGLGWPVTLAKRYLCTRLKYSLGPAQRRAIAKFFELAARHGYLPSLTPLVYA